MTDEDDSGRGEQDAADYWPYCECDNHPDAEEMNSLRCKACGKEITP